MKYFGGFTVACLALLLALPAGPACADPANLIKPLRPGDIIFSTGDIAGIVGPRFGAKALHGHLSVYLGRKEEFSRYLRPDQIEKYIKNWAIRDYNPFYKVNEDDVLVYDMYPRPAKAGTYVRFRNIASRFFNNASGKKYPFPISESQRREIIQFLFDNVETRFDINFINDINDRIWTCNELCEAAYEKAGVSILKLIGTKYADMFRINIPLMDDRGNGTLPHVLSYYLMDFMTVEVSNNFTEFSGIKYYAVKLKGRDMVHKGERSDCIIRIRHDLSIVDIFCDLFGFRQTIAGPFDTEQETLDFITDKWDKDYQIYLNGLRLGTECVSRDNQ